MRGPPTRAVLLLFPGPSALEPDPRDDGDEGWQENGETKRAGCRVTYTVALSQTFTAKAVALTVDGEHFEFANPIQPGARDKVSITRPEPAECKKMDNG